MRGIHPLVLVLALGMAWGGLACSADPEVAKREYLKSGDEFVAQGRLQEAIVQYRNAVQQDPRFGEARQKLADSYAKHGDSLNAMREYVRAADAMPDNVAAQVKAAGVLLAARQFEDAQGRAEKALAQDPKNVEALILRAQALARLEKLDDALREIEEAVRLDGSRADAYATLGALRLIRGERVEAEAAFKEAVQIDSTSVQARLALAQFYWSVGRTSDAESQLKSALSIDPKHVFANRVLAFFYLSNGRAAEAEPHFKTLADVLPLGSGKLALADYYFKMRRPTDARAILEPLAKGDSEASRMAKVRLAVLSGYQGDPRAAQSQLEEVLAKDDDNVDALVTKASLLAEQAQWDEALKAAVRAAEVEPRSAAAHFWIGRIRRMQGQVSGAIEALTQALQLNPRLAAAELELAQLNLAAGKIDDAESSARSAFTKAPQSVEAQLLVAHIALLKGDTASAESLLDSLASRFPAAGPVQREVGRLQLKKNNLAAARTALEKAVAANPQDTEALGLLINMDIKASSPAAAKARVEAAIARQPRDARTLILGARVYGNLKEFAKTEELLRRAIEADSTANEAFALLGQLYNSQGRTAQALTEFETLARRNPNATGPHIVVGMMLGLLNRRPEAKQAYRRALEIDPNAPVAANNLAWMYAEDGENLDEALQLAQLAKSRLPAVPEISDTLGWIYYKKGLVSMAVPILKEAAEKQPTNAGFQFHLGLAQAKNGETALARQALEAALGLDANAREAEEARRVLAQLRQGT